MQDPGAWHSVGGTLVVFLFFFLESLSYCMETTPSQFSVVHLVAPARFGGLESVVETLAAGQASSGDSVCVAAVLSDGDGSSHPFVEAVERRGVEVVTLQIGVREYRKERREVAALLRRRGAHILHTHGYRPDVVDAPVARALGVGTVTTVHGYTGGGWKNRLYERLQKRSHRRFGAVIAVSAKLRGELIRAGVSAERAHALPNAWEVPRAVEPRDQARRALSIDGDAPIVGWVGRLSREKAPDIAVRVLAAARTLNARLAVVGSGPMDHEARALAESLGIAERVQWHGFVPNAGLRLRAFDALLITSWTEGTPVTLLEAMAAGVPVVTTAVGGIPDVVGPAEAWLAPAGDVGALAAALDDSISDPAAVAARTAAARRRLETAFAVGPWVERHREIYRWVLAER
jgi:glycosyltransferase involved in cell wall biosynthesis